MRTYTTHSGSEYKTTKTFTGTIIAQSIVNGSMINPAWKKDMMMITMNINGHIQSYFTEETVSTQVGDIITTHASINKMGVRFISMRHITKVAA